MATAGHTCTLKTTGSAVAVTGEATTTSAPYAVFTITNAARRVMDPATAITVKKNGVTQTGSLYLVNYLFGQITFLSPLVVTDVVTVDYAYLPLLSLAETRSFELSLSSSMLETTVMDASTANRSRVAGLRDASGSIGTLDNLLTDLDPGAGAVRVWQEWFDAGENRVVEVSFPGGQKFRAFARLPDVKLSSGFDALVEGSINWSADARTGVGRTDGVAFGIGY